jgi:hypothetical protein
MTEVNTPLALRYFGKRLIAIAPTYRLKGEPKSKSPYMKPYSATLLEFEGSYSLLTAGHVIDAINELYEDPTIEMDGCYLLDDLNIDAKYHHPVPFAWETAVKASIDEDGLDFGVVLLSPYFARSLLANGVAPVTESNWVHQERLETYDNYILLGLPEELNMPTRFEPGGDVEIVPLLLPLLPTEQPPEGMVLPNNPIHIFRLAANPMVKSLKGMSGGPIIGMRLNEAGELRYWILGVLRTAKVSERYITACPMPVLGKILRDQFDKTIAALE